MRLDEAHKHGHVLTSGRFVGPEAQEDEGEPFEQTFARLHRRRRAVRRAGPARGAQIQENLNRLDWAIEGREE